MNPDETRALTSFLASCNVSPLFWQMLREHDGPSNASVVDSLLELHKLSNISDDVKGALQACVASFKKIKPISAEHKGPTQFQINHIYSRTSPSCFIESDESSSVESLISNEIELFLVQTIIDDDKTTAKVHWLYTRQQIDDSLPDAALKVPKSSNLMSQLEDHPKVFALSDHTQELSIDDCTELKDVTMQVAWVHLNKNRHLDDKNLAAVITHFQPTQPTVPARPIATEVVFENRSRLLQNKHMLQKVLLARSGNDKTAITMFDKIMNAKTFTPVFRAGTYKPCAFTENTLKRKRTSTPRKKFESLQFGAVFSVWAHAVLMMCRYATHNIPFFIKKDAIDEFETWAEALYANPNDAKVKYGTTELVNLNVTPFAPSLFKHIHI